MKVDIIICLLMQMNKIKSKVFFFFKEN